MGGILGFQGGRMRPVHHTRTTISCRHTNILGSPDNKKDAPARPPIRPIPAARSKFDLEPNPFEQSFSARSHRSQSDIEGGDEPAPVGLEGDKGKETSGISTRSKGKGKLSGKGDGGDEDGGDTPPRGGDATATKPLTLPPLSSLTSPAAADPMQFPWLANQSLRAGPLSPAMLAGPQSQKGSTGHAAGEGEGGFDTSTFRTGFTPGTGTGFTPSYSSMMGGSGFQNLPLPSPNTAAFLNMVTNATPIEADVDTQAGAAAGTGTNGSGNGNGNGQGEGGDAANNRPASGLPPHMQSHGLSHLSQDAGDTITPNTLSALTGVFNDMNRQNSNPGQNANGNGNTQGQGQGQGQRSTSGNGSQGQVPTQGQLQPQGQGQGQGHPPMHHAHSQPLAHPHGQHPHAHMTQHASFYPGQNGGPQGQGPQGPGPQAGPHGPGQQVDYAQQSANAASQAANGLFLLSQAHQELSKREEDSRGPGMAGAGAGGMPHMLQHHSSTGHPQHQMPGHGHMAPHLPHAHSMIHAQAFPGQGYAGAGAGAGGAGPYGPPGGSGHPGMQNKRGSGSQPPSGIGASGAGAAAGGAGGKGTKRKSDASAAPTKAKKGKKGTSERNGSQGPGGGGVIPGTGMSMPGIKGESSSPMNMGGMHGDDSDVEEMDDGGMDENDPNRKPETEEEKRKNFLERNRQGKCFGLLWFALGSWVLARPVLSAGMVLVWLGDGDEGRALEAACQGQRMADPASAPARAVHASVRQREELALVHTCY